MLATLPMEDDNPFAVFAFSEGPASDLPLSTPTDAAAPIQPLILKKATKKRPREEHSKEEKTVSSFFAPPSSSGEKQKGKQAQAKGTKAPAAASKKSQKKKVDVCCEEDFQSFTVEQKNALIKKWRAMVDRTAGKQDQMFQMLVSVILSSRAQEVIVKQALEKLKRVLTQEGKEFTAEAVAAMEIDSAAEICKSVHYNKAKAAHIVAAAKAIQETYRGNVPLKEKDLITLPGVGPTLSKLLNFLYTHWEEEKIETSPKKQKTHDAGGNMHMSMNNFTVKSSTEATRNGAEKPARKGPKPSVDLSQFAATNVKLPPRVVNMKGKAGSSMSSKVSVSSAEKEIGEGSSSQESGSLVEEEPKSLSQEPEEVIELGDSD